MKRLIIFLTLSLFAMSGYTGVLRSFLDVHYAVTNGRPIHLVFDFSKCTSDHHDLPKKMRYFLASPDSIVVLEDYITSSITHFTVSNPAYPGKAVYEIGKYKVNVDNTVTLTHQVFDAVSYTPIGDVITYDCTLGLGVKIYG